MGVSVKTCNMTNRWQDWEWTEQGKLRLRQQGQCLSLASNTSSHTHRLTLRDCTGGLRWKCYHDEPGQIGLADQEMFLKKMGYLALLKAEKKYYDSWLRYQLGGNGKPVTLNICPTQGEVLVTSHDNQRCWKGEARCFIHECIQSFHSSDSSD